MITADSKALVKYELEKLGFNCIAVELVEVECDEKFSEEQLINLELALQAHGLEIVDAKKITLIKRIKNAIIKFVNHSDRQINEKFSYYISRELQHDYTYISNFFSKIEGITLEHYVITEKNEKVKNLLLYEDLSLGEIANKMHYSSVSHLSKQFKKVTGVTATEFRQMRQNQSPNNINK
jgi:YesN/AraC family two-component response regulator